MNKKILFLLVLMILSSCTLIDDYVKFNKPKYKSQVGLSGVKAEISQKICSQKKCVTTSYEARTSNLLTIVLIGNDEIKNFLIENGISTLLLSTSIDFLEVIKDPNGKLNELNFLITTNETKNVDPNLCQGIKNINIECRVEVYIPTEEGTNIKNIVDKACLVAFGNVIPDYVDLGCIIINLV